MLSTISKIFSEQTIEKMKVHYTNYTVEQPPGAIFRARTDYATITAYKSGKVLFQGKDTQAELNKWPATGNAIQTEQPFFNEHTQNEFAPPEHLFEKSHIGSDESGSGDYFGPITTCAMYVQEEHIQRLKDMGIQDSKAIQDNQDRKSTRLNSSHV